MHLNLYFVAGWIQGHFLVQCNLNLVGYLAAPSSLLVLVGGGLFRSLSDSQPLYRICLTTNEPIIHSIPGTNDRCGNVKSSETAPESIPGLGQGGYVYELN